MDKTILGQTTFEQMPPGYKSGIHRHAHKPWAYIIVGVVAVLFGLYYLYAHRAEYRLYTPAVTTPVPATPTPAISQAQNTDAPTDIGDLQSAAVNIPVTSYSAVF